MRAFFKNAIPCLIIAFVFFSVPAYTEESAPDISAIEVQANQGNAEAQNDLAIAYHSGDRVKQDSQEAVKWWRKAAEQGNGTAEYNLGTAYYNGTGIKKNDNEAVKWWSKAAAQGDATAQSDIDFINQGKENASAPMYLPFSVRTAYAGNITPPAIAALQTKAEQGDVNAQYNLGTTYYNGTGIKKNDDEAVKWWRKAAEQGDPDAEYNLGFLYYKGQEVKQDYVEAFKWYRKSAEQGNVYAQNAVGSLYHDGLGVKQDYAEATKWYRKSAEQRKKDKGEPFAQGGYIQYMQGLYVQCIKDAIESYKGSTEAADVIASGALGHCESFRSDWMDGLPASLSPSQRETVANELDQNLRKWAISLVLDAKSKPAPAPPPDKSFLGGLFK
jgi:TPR repeat protein